MTPSAPIAPIHPHTYTLHGQTITDDYFWLRDRQDPQVMDYLQAENGYTEAVLEPQQELREQLYQELKSRIKEDDSSPPAKSDNYYYYSRVESGKQYRIHCRKRDSLDTAEEILLDGNELAETLPYFSLGIFDISLNHEILAYSVDSDGSESYTIRFKNLVTGALFPEELPHTYYSSAWGNDNQTFYYAVLDDAQRPYRIYRHHLGTPVTADELLYEETDSQFFIGVSKSNDDRYIFLDVDGSITSEVHLLSADDPTAKFQCFAPRQRGIEYDIFHHEGYFYIHTNEDALNFRLLKTPVTTTARSAWEEVIPHDPECLLEGVEEFKTFWVIYERRLGLQFLRIWDLRSGEKHEIEVNDPTYSIYGAANYEYDTEIFRFAYSSMVLPTTVYDYDVRSRQKVIVKQDEVPGGYDPDLYASERLWATAEDGQRVPISLVYAKSVPRDGSAPLYLTGYGAYGISSNAYFSSLRLSLLERGFVYAIAHIRGGSDLGRSWYESGKFLHKKNTFTDFIACAEHLIAQGYTTTGMVAISGGSAGGLLMGAAVNLRPDLFRAAIADVPFVDVLNTMLDDTLPLTQLEFDEWGNPQDEVYFNYIQSYSPYDNVTSQAYPHLLVTAGLNDPRVTYWEPAKWVAKLRRLKTDQNLLLLKTNMDAGHGGSSGRYERLKEEALEFTFLLRVFGMATV
ncbi:MAG: S9 family peptidase [Oscillatoriales cyanobacterium SM2_2_1]|nr:S9 family peptidase [Oscillatoriales cyanobacterium SM2_2_1]